MTDHENARTDASVKSAEEARRFLEAEQKARVEECSRRIQAALTECTCRLESQVTVTGSRVTSEILVLPIP